jgi:6-pyruvoyl-tetrahydropterin synthase
MKIYRKYHFYAGHRNEDAGEKCSRMHGHTYEVECCFAWHDFNGDVAMLFNDIDEKAEPIIKYFDHYFILWAKDPMCEVMDEVGEVYRKVDFVTSAENMAKHLYDLIGEELPIERIRLAETKSGFVEYKG